MIGDMGQKDVSPNEIGQDPSPGFVDHAEHLKAWLSDADRDTKRKAALQAVTTEIDAMAVLLGYVRDGRQWSRKTMGMTTAVSIQAGRSGDRCFVNLGCAGGFRRRLQNPGASDQAQRLGRFYAPGESDWGEPGVLYYYDFDRRPDKFAQAMDILRSRAMPWLAAHHMSWRSPSIEDYLQPPMAGRE